jgi:calcineurin-like phosphoesterase family protein
MQYWACSDFHLQHLNIIKYCDRPFKSLAEMNETIIKNVNERVKPNDIVYFLGDYLFRNSPGGKEGEGETSKAQEWQKKFNGQWIYLRGNHDNNNSLKSLNHRLIAKFGGMYIGMTHRPEDVIIEDEKHYYPLNLVGHVHNNWLTKEITKNGKYSLLLNVGVDNNKFYPYNFDEVKAIFDHWLSQHKFRKDINRCLLTQSQKNK